MERHSGSRFLHQHMHSLSPKENLLGYSPGISRLNFEPFSKNPYSAEDPMPGIDPFILPSAMQESKNDKSNHLCLPNLFYRTHFDQAFAPSLISASTKKFPAGTVDFKQKEGPITGATPAQKRFLVFDQSGGKTTLMCISGAETPVQCGAFRVQKPPAYNLIKEDPWISLYPPEPNMNDEHLNNNSQYNMEDEMHEDTEELNALLYSDSKSVFPDDEEEISTGHSPITLTDNGIRDFVEETVEEVDSFTGPTKRQKLSDGCYDETSQMRTGSSLKTFACSVFEDDAESTCGSDNKQTTGGRRSLSGTKRKERIQETVTILRSIFPSINGKDAADVIDQAIHFLKFLKVKAKAFGL